MHTKVSKTSKNLILRAIPLHPVPRWVLRDESKGFTVPIDISPPGLVHKEVQIHGTPLLGLFWLLILLFCLRVTEVGTPFGGTSCVVQFDIQGLNLN